MNKARVVSRVLLLLVLTQGHSLARQQANDGGVDDGSAGPGPSILQAPTFPEAPPLANAWPPPAVAHTPPAVRSLEFNIVPIAGGDSDVGIGGGEVADLARLDPRYHPYRWKLTSEAFVTFSLLNGQLISPYQDYSIVWTLPELTSSRRLRLEIRPAFTNERTLKFYGVCAEGVVLRPQPAGARIRPAGKD